MVLCQHASEGIVKARYLTQPMGCIGNKAISQYAMSHTISITTDPSLLP